MYFEVKKTNWLYIRSESRISQWAGSLARLGHPLDVRKVTGSNPVRPTMERSLFPKREPSLRENGVFGVVLGFVLV